MIGFDLECVELAGKLAIEQQGDDNDNDEDDQEKEIKDEEENLQVKNQKVNEPEEKEDESSSEENVEKLIDFHSLKLVDKSQTEMIKSKPKIEELD